MDSVIFFNMEGTLSIILRLMELAVTSLTLGTLVWGLLKMFESAREAAATRAETQQAATKAAYHAANAAQVVVAMADNIQKIELATNSMKDELVAATAKSSGMEGEERGRRLAEATRKAKEDKPR